jgi:hypothetical protein
MAKKNIDGLDWLFDEKTTSVENDVKQNATKGEKATFDPFKNVENEEMIDDSHDVVLQAFESGRIDLKTAVEALNRSYTAQHAVGQGALDDQRLKPITRIRRYVEWAVSQGQDATEAATYAFMKIASQDKIAGKWGTVARDVGIDIEELKKKAA